jgi:hypothetical protein
MGVHEGDLRAVAEAYMQVQSAKGDEEPAFQLALAVFRGRHPEMSPEEAFVRVGRLVSEAVETYGLWRHREGSELLDS